jgi:DNA-binding winged helix-turn-helix (wHTH) protein
MWRFLRSEMMVILSLVEDATRTDKEVAELYGMNVGTVAAVRRRLVDAGAVYYVNIPSFSKLGCEMMCFHVGSTDPAVSSDVKVSNYLEFCSRSPQVYDAIIGGNSLSLFSVFRNGTEMEKFIQSHNRFFSGSKRASKAGLATTAFPYSISRGTYSTNFAPMVHRFFGLDVPAPKARPLVSNEVESMDLSPNEQRVLIALVENPMVSDRRLASVAKLSRQAITRIRHKLEDGGYYTSVCVPRLYKWGFEIYAVVRAQFTLDFGWSKRMQLQPKETTDLSFFTLSKADEGVGNYMVSSFQEYVSSIDPLLAWYHKSRALDESPEISLFSLEQCIELKTFEFGPVIRHLLSGSG